MDCLETGQRNVKQTPSGELPQTTKCPNNSWIAEKRKEISLNNFIYSFSAKNTHTGVPWAAIPPKIEFLVFTSLANQFKGEKHKSRLYLSKRLIVSLLRKLSSSSFSFRFWKYLLVKLMQFFTLLSTVRNTKCLEELSKWFLKTTTYSEDCCYLDITGGKIILIYSLL